MQNQAHIQFINFDYVSEEDNQCNIATELVGMEINNFLLNRFETEYDIQYSNYLNSQKNPTSFLQDTQTSKTNYTATTTPVETQSKKLGESQEISQDIQEKENSTKDVTTFPCEYDNCQKTFKFKWILDRHYLSHKPTKLFKCDYEKCGKSYKSKENLTFHIKNIHLKEKPYNCRYCSSVFSHRNGKTYHERKFHTNYLPHKCTIQDCGLTFASKSALTYHLKSQHSSNDDSSSKSNKRKRTKFNHEILRYVNEDTNASNNLWTNEGFSNTLNNKVVD